MSRGYPLELSIMISKDTQGVSSLLEKAEGPGVAGGDWRLPGIAFPRTPPITHDSLVAAFLSNHGSSSHSPWLSSCWTVFLGSGCGKSLLWIRGSVTGLGVRGWAQWPLGENDRTQLIEEQAGLVPKPKSSAGSSLRLSVSEIDF